MRGLIASAMAAVVALVVLAAPAPAAAQEQQRPVALVIGNQAYQSLSALDNPRLDAGQLADLLAANGFDVLSCDGKRPGCFDLRREALRDALETFRDRADGVELALVFYAGHGMEVRDANVLAAVHMEIVDCTQRALRRGVPLDELFKAAAGAHNKIVILDACREDPLKRCPPCAAPAR